jgi:hypothetical protein
VLRVQCLTLCIRAIACTPSCMVGTRSSKYTLCRVMHLGRALGPAPLLMWTALHPRTRLLD